MRGLPSFYDQRYARYRILAFVAVFGPFWVKNRVFTRIWAWDFFKGKIRSPNDNKITKIAFVQIYSRSTSYRNPEMTGLMSDLSAGIG